MESLSLESTIESPTKPHQEKAPDKDKKSMFLINVISDEKIKEQESQNLENKEINENGEIKESASKLLNFDDILAIVFPEKKPKKIVMKKSGKKLIGCKRERQTKTESNKSKNIFFIFCV